MSAAKAGVVMQYYVALRSTAPGWRLAFAGWLLGLVIVVTSLRLGLATV